MMESGGRLCTHDKQQENENDALARGTPRLHALTCTFLDLNAECGVEVMPSGSCTRLYETQH